jgi:hypothetical protein
MNWRTTTLFSSVPMYFALLAWQLQTETDLTGHAMVDEVRWNRDSTTIGLLVKRMAGPREAGTLTRPCAIRSHSFDWGSIDRGRV